MSGREKAGIGAGVAAAAAAAALGAYFLYGKNGKENRKKVKGWMLQAKGEILERMENLDNVSEEAYDRIINAVVSNYKGARNVTSSELMALAADARRHWKVLKPMFQSGKSRAGARQSGTASSHKRAGGARKSRASGSRRTNRRNGSGKNKSSESS
jgi:hypothetical protein